MNIATEATFDGTRGYYVCQNCGEIHSKKKSFDGTEPRYCPYCGKRTVYKSLGEK